MINFKTYQLSKAFYKECEKVQTNRIIKNQLQRASLSICLNLAEGYGKFKGPDQQRYFKIAFGSLKEVQAILELINTNPELITTADILSAMIYRLTWK